ncbi:hypothetical protein BDF22DRAFT_725063 [Syncephalis plumigaleata]|nr:hypothetical protein BDF22DRAFT_725063 [Syncephalis plumigaleata]
MDSSLSNTLSPAGASHSTQNPPKKSMKEMTKKERRELQERQRAEKAAQKAANTPEGAGNKTKKAATTSTTGGGGASTSNVTSTGGSGAGGSSAKTTASSATAAAATGTGTGTTKSKRNALDQEYPSLVAHLNVAKGSTNKADKDVHPAILALGLAYAEHRICGSNARCVALLGALKKVIRDYQTPPNMHISRHLQTYLSPQINFLVSMRPLSVSMGNAIRYLKYEISILDVDTSDEESKKHIIGRIDAFINERILRADEEIVEHAVRKIHDGDVILTYARSSAVQQVLLAAKESGIQFKVIVVDSRPLLEGKRLVSALNNAGIECTYSWLNGLSIAMEKASATKVFLGAHAMLSNGAMLSRAGTASMALAANERRVPVLVCCETYKFTDRVQMDSFVWNELGKLQSMIMIMYIVEYTRRSPLQAVADNPRLKLLSMTYDVTPPSLMNLIVTDIGMIPCESVSMVLREYK